MSARLELALDLLKPSDWRRFEEFASEFLVGEFPELRDMSAPSGDGGRDAEVYSSKNDPTQVFQYSVTSDWVPKIRQTAKLLQETTPAAQVLVYASPKRIGADADALKQELRKNFRLHLDIRDRTYFTLREASNRLTEVASERLASDVVDPFLASRKVTTGKSTGLSTSETRAAHVFLMLQLRDDTAEKVLRSFLSKRSSDRLWRT